jgi:hypothetical protein
VNGADAAARLAAPPHRSDTPERSEEDQRAFFNAAMDRCLQAEGRAGPIRRKIDLAGTHVELVFAGERLVAACMAALAHLIEPPDDGPAAVTIHVWDSSSTGVEMVAPLWTSACFTDRGDIWGMNHPRLRSAFHYYDFSLNLLDLDSRTGMFWVRSADQLPDWTLAAPFRTLFHWWLEENGGQLLHAAAIGSDQGAVLISGRGGAGKSTTALACLAGGMQYLADDYVAVRLEPEPRVYSLYCTAKLDARQLERFPHLRSLVTNPTRQSDEKAVIQLVPRYAGQVQRSLALRAIATPSFGAESRTIVSAASSAAVQRATAFTTLSQLPHAGQRTHAFIDRLVHRLPGLHLALGHDTGTLPETLRGILQLDDAELARLGAPADAAPDMPVRPLLTAIIPVYNGAGFLAHAVSSVLAQGYPAIEIIVVDDGSTDDLGAAVRSLPVDVRCFRQENAGAAAARNRGIRDASGELLAFLDVDDLWPEGALDSLVGVLLEHPDVDVVHGRAQVTRLTTYDAPGEYLGSPSESFPYYLGAGVYRRRAFERVGVFDADLRFSEDSDWFTRAASRGLNIVEMDEVTLLVRRHDANITRGKSLPDLDLLRLFKKAIDRRRAETGSVSADEAR